jgi:hypothetical protein
VRFGEASELVEEVVELYKGTIVSELLSGEWFFNVLN